MQQIELEYDRWLESQIEILRSRKFEQPNVDNLIEELDALGRAEKSAVKSLVYQILLHLLLVDYWKEESEYCRNHWLSEVNAFQRRGEASDRQAAKRIRAALEDKLTANLTKLAEAELPRLYTKARKNASRKSSLPEQRFPVLCPYTLEDVENRG